MLCFDCLTDAKETPSVAVCTRCGAAACQTHARATTVTVRRPMGLAGPADDRTQRQMLCTGCHPAGTSVTV